MRSSPRPDEFDELVRSESPGLLRYFRRRVQDPEDAADLLGSTLLVLWRRRSSVPNASDEARRWLYGVAHRVLATERRARMRRSALEVRLGADLAIAIRDQPPVDDERRDTLRRLLAGLDEVDREIVGLVYWEGFSLAEVARILRLNPASVRSRHARARTRMLADLARDSPSLFRDEVRK